MSWLVLLSCGSTCCMAGVIWMVQLVHYPLLGRCNGGNWSEIHRFHTSAMTPLVLPLMGVELITVHALLLEYGLSGPGRMALGLTALTWLNWGITGLVAVPLHRSLATGFDARILDRLVRWNWARTAAWSLKAVLHLYFLRTVA